MKKLPDAALDRIERILEIKEEISLLQVEKSRLLSEVADLVSPFKEGDVIEYKRSTQVRKAKVISSALRYADSVDDFDPSRIRLRVQGILKDGSLGKESMVYSYDDPKLVSRGNEAQKT